jgi:predicted ABC-type ATPase
VLKLVKLLLPVGIQGSGKTTWRNMMVKRHGDKIGVISPDKIREEIFNVEYDPRLESWTLITR